MPEVFLWMKRKDFDPKMKERTSSDAAGWVRDHPVILVWVGFLLSSDLRWVRFSLLFDPIQAGFPIDLEQKRVESSQYLLWVLPSNILPLMSMSCQEVMLNY